MLVLTVAASSTGLILPSTSTLLWGAIAYLVVVSGLLIGTVLLVRWGARRATTPRPRPPCSFGPNCPCDCHDPTGRDTT